MDFIFFIIICISIIAFFVWIKLPEKEEEETLTKQEALANKETFTKKKIIEEKQENLAPNINNLKNDMSKIIDSVIELEQLAKIRKEIIFKIIDNISINQQKMLEEVIHIINRKYLNRTEKEFIQDNEICFIEYDNNRIEHAHKLDNVEKKQYLSAIALDIAERKSKKREIYQNNIELIKKMINIPIEKSEEEQKHYFLVRTQLILHIEKGGGLITNKTLIQ